jgi:polyisoprenoid-binding protein YceI
MYLKQKNMKKTITLVIFLSLLAVNLHSMEKWIADKTRTKLEWLGEKVAGQHSGTINLHTGWIAWDGDKITGGEFLIDMASIQDADKSQKLEGHLKSDDFFGVEKYPVSKLVITGSTSFAKGTGVVNGNLTIKDITHPVEFKASLQKSDDGLWYFANIVVDRSKYNVRYGSGSFFDNLGDKIIYDEFKLKVNLLVKKA